MWDLWAPNPQTVLIAKERKERKERKESFPLFEVFSPCLRASVVPIES
jgi:hypothetical protein